MAWTKSRARGVETMWNEQVVVDPGSSVRSLSGDTYPSLGLAHRRGAMIIQPQNEKCHYHLGHLTVVKTDQLTSLQIERRIATRVPGCGV